MLNRPCGVPLGPSSTGRAKENSSAPFVAVMNSTFASRGNPAIQRTASATCALAEVARMLKAIHAHEGPPETNSEAKEIVARLKELKLRTSAELVEQKVAETMTSCVCVHVRCRTDY